MQNVAVKQIKLEDFDEKEIAQIMQEVDLVKRLLHPNIIKFEGAARDKKTLVIVLECVSYPALPITFAWLLLYISSDLCIVLVQVCQVRFTQAHAR
jgi:serine/threonine protein kinase